MATPTDAQRRIDRPAWITSADYPADAIKAGVGGIVVVRLDYSASGVVTRCKADGRRATRALGDLTCRLIQQRACYVPAGDRSGKARAGKDEFAVTWDPATRRIDYSDMDNGMARPIGASYQWVTTDDLRPGELARDQVVVSAFRFGITPEGKLDRCIILSDDGRPDLAQRACLLYMVRARFKAPLDDKGQPMASEGKARVRWQVPTN